ncbi:hypothetical protein X971_0966 [Agrobacterium tumefaciens LBA4213 (Ach5)]|nr:hypothetical protein X971_0966 [Agrobacterium tumefaciens LBA4213 (Ach5)]
MRPRSGLSLTIVSRNALRRLDGNQDGAQALSGIGELANVRRVLSFQNTPDDIADIR